MNSPTAKPFKIAFPGFRMLAFASLVSARIKAEYLRQWRKKHKPWDYQGDVEVWVWDGRRYRTVAVLDDEGWHELEQVHA